MADFNTLKVDGSGLKIQITEWPGSEHTILAIHGISANGRSFETIADSLSPPNRILAMDLRGRGLSDAPDSGYSVDNHCKDIKEVLNNLGLEKVILMGHSLGAYISLAFTARYPEKVEKLILLDGGADLEPEEWVKVNEGIKPSLDRLGKVYPSFEAYVEGIKAAPFLKPWNQALENYYRYECEEVPGGLRSGVKPKHIAEERGNLRSLDLPSIYPKIKCPALLLRAAEGLLQQDQQVVPPQAAVRLKAQVPSLRVVDLEKINHFSIVFHPSQERDQAIKDFLAQ